MAKLSDFTNRACAEARSVAKCGRDSSIESGSSPLGPTRRPPDDDPPAQKAARSVASARSPDDVDVSSTPTSPLPLGSARRAPVYSLPARSATEDELSSVRTSAGVSVSQYSAPPAPVVARFR